MFWPEPLLVFLRSLLRLPFGLVCVVRFLIVFKYISHDQIPEGTMVLPSSYKGLLKQLLRYTEKVERYRHHVTFNTTYVQLNYIPKGFRLKSHNNIEECDLSGVLNKCSKKLMIKTIGAFKEKLKSSLSVFDSTFEELTRCYPDKSEEFCSKMKNCTDNQREKLSQRREKKFERDGLVLVDARDISQKFLLTLTQRSTPPDPVDALKEEILSDVVIPPYDPINLDAKKRELPTGLTELCSRGPSFIPVPTSYDWLQLQKDFDRFRNSIRTKVFFSKQQPNPAPETTEIRPPKKKSRWKPPKCSIPEVEVYLNKVERDLFSHTKRKRIDDNLTEPERHALKKWREEHLYNQDSDLIIRQQDKGNRFIIVDKETDISKAEEQIQRSSFRTIDYDPTLDHVESVKKWAAKWLEKKEITADWVDFIVNEDAQPGKNTPLYKTHKENTPARLLTTGCNTAIENLSRFLEVHSAPLSAQLPSRIKDTGHLLEIIDELNAKGIPDNAILVSFDVVNMFPNIDNERGIQTLQTA